MERKTVEYANDVWMRLFMENAHARIALTVLFMTLTPSIGAPTLTAARVSEACNVASPRGRSNARDGPPTEDQERQGPSRHSAAEAGRTAASMMLSQELIDGGQSVFGYSGRWSVNQAIERVCDKVNLKAGAIRLEKVEDKTEKRRVILGPLALEYYSSHQVGRHAFAAQLLAEGKSLRLVQEGGGWAGIQIVAEAYGHLAQSHVDDALRETGDCLITKLVLRPSCSKSLKLTGKILARLRMAAISSMR